MTERSQLITCTGISPRIWFQNSSRCVQTVSFFLIRILQSKLKALSISIPGKQTTKEIRQERGVLNVTESFTPARSWTACLKGSLRKLMNGDSSSFKSIIKELSTAVEPLTFVQFASLTPCLWMVSRRSQAQTSLTKHIKHIMELNARQSLLDCRTGVNSVD